MAKNYLDYEGLQNYNSRIQSEISAIKNSVIPHAILTQTEYDALPAEQKNKGVYFIPGSPGIDSPRYAILTQAEFDALPKVDQNAGLYFIVDEEGEMT